MFFLVIFPVKFPFLITSLVWISSRVTCFLVNSLMTLYRLKGQQRSLSRKINDFFPSWCGSAEVKAFMKIALYVELDWLLHGWCEICNSVHTVHTFILHFGLTFGYIRTQCNMSSVVIHLTLNSSHSKMSHFNLNIKSIFLFTTHPTRMQALCH